MYNFSVFKITPAHVAAYTLQPSLSLAWLKNRGFLFETKCCNDITRICLITYVVMFAGYPIRFTRGGHFYNT